MHRQRVWIPVILSICWFIFLARTEADDSVLDTKVIALAEPAGVQVTSIGVTSEGTPIQATIAPDDFVYESRKTRILIVAGLSSEKSTPLVAAQWREHFHKSNDIADLRERFTLSTIATLQPDATAAGHNELRKMSFPPKGSAYQSKTTPEAAYAWRWIGMHAPDLVIELVADEQVKWEIPTTARRALADVAKSLEPVGYFKPDSSLVGQLPTVAACETGTIPAMRVSISPDGFREAFDKTNEALLKANFSATSPAREEIQRRLNRSPSEIKSELLEHYGKQLKQVVYIQSLAVLGRMRHLEQGATDTNEEPDYSSIESITSDYYGGDKVAKLKTGSDLSGHLIFSELASRFDGEKQARYIELARRTADLAFNKDGTMKPSMPFHNEMSDALFMGGPILAQVGALTGETKYFDACIQHLRFMRKLDWRDDGLYRHSPLDEAAWGRGNGFPAIGVAMCLDALPRDHPGRNELLESFQRHMEALAKHQDPNGCWHQVIDHPESYREFTCTCMITYAMLRGISEGWLDTETYEPIITKAWYAIRTRIGKDGKLVDVCTGTGKQKSLRNYFDRTAILGRDDRGGAMALLVANEIDQWHSKTQQDTARDNR